MPTSHDEPAQKGPDQPRWVLYVSTNLLTIEMASSPGRPGLTPPAVWVTVPAAYHEHAGTPLAAADLRLFYRLTPAVFAWIDLRLAALERSAWAAWEKGGRDTEAGRELERQHSVAAERYAGLQEAVRPHWDGWFGPAVRAARAAAREGRRDQLPELPPAPVAREVVEQWARMDAPLVVAPPEAYYRLSAPKYVPRKTGQGQAKGRGKGGRGRKGTGREGQGAAPAAGPGLF